MRRYNENDGKRKSREMRGRDKDTQGRKEERR
jgi:hypothetical protein